MARIFLIRPGGYQDLVLICIVGVLTVILSIYFPGSLPLFFISFFCIFFAPGWALVSCLFPGPRPKNTGDQEYSEMTLPLRVAASITLSVLLYAIGGLLLAWSPLMLTEVTVLAETLVLTLGLSALAIWRRASLAPGEGLSLSVEVPRRERFNRAERAVLVVAVAGLLFGSMVAVDNLMKGSQVDPFTELFITGPDGKVSSLPLRLTAGTDGIVQIHINNHMGSAVDYVLTVGIPIDHGFTNVTALEWSSQHALVPGDGYRYEFTAIDGQEMVGDFTFSIGSAGSQQVLFLLDFEGDILDTWLWVTVT